MNQLIKVQQKKFLQYVNVHKFLNEIETIDKYTCTGLPPHLYKITFSLPIWSYYLLKKSTNPQWYINFPENKKWSIRNGFLITKGLSDVVMIFYPFAPSLFSFVMLNGNVDWTHAPYHVLLKNSDNMIKTVMNGSGVTWVWRMWRKK